MNKTVRYLTTFAFTALFSTFTMAADILTMKNIGLEAANDIAMESVKACREKGFQVAAVVVDKNGNLRSAMRDDLAARQTLEIAERKANMSIMSGMATGAFRAARGDIQQELNHIGGLIVMQGGLPITAAGSIIGAVGVSGAPGGEKDEACAAIALEKIAERLEFAE